MKKKLCNSKNLLYTDPVVQKVESIQNSSGEAFTFQASDGAVIHGIRWIPENSEIKTVLIINHGMAEHISRYEDVAEYLCSHGIAVWGEDHRGHGLTAGSEDLLGHFADKDGWMTVLNDIRSLYLLVKENHPGLPVIMLGQSMGSFLTRHYISLYGKELAGAVLMGTAYHYQITIGAGMLLADLQIRIKGSRYRSKLLDRLSFGQFNQPFKSEGNTGFEWLSRDSGQVLRYHNDPLCGFVCTCGFFRDLFSGLRIINGADAFRKAPDNLPLLLISGDKDPVGDKGSGVRKVFNLYRKSGIQDATLFLLNEHRHECLNETENEKVYKILSDWMEMKVIS